MNTNLAYSDQPREELLDGKVTLMSPRPTYGHNWVAENISFLFRLYLRGKSCTPLGDGYDVYLSEKDRFVPDFMVVCDREKITPKGVMGAPDLVVEVLSPSTGGRDRGYKKDAYGKYGVREYWIVDPANRTVEQYLPREGKLALHAFYALLDPEDRVEGEDSPAFRCSLYDDFTIRLDDIFSETIP